MKFKILSILIISTSIISCSTNSESTENVSIEKTSNLGIRINNKTVTKYNTGQKNLETDTTYYVNSEYFEIALKKGQGDFYIGENYTKKLTDEHLKMEVFLIVDTDNNIVEHTTPASFLNYMSSKGYSVFSQEKFKYETKYMFKLKE